MIKTKSRSLNRLSHPGTPQKYLKQRNKQTNTHARHIEITIFWCIRLCKHIIKVKFASFFLLLQKNVATGKVETTPVAHTLCQRESAVPGPPLGSTLPVSPPAEHSTCCGCRGLPLSPRPQEEPLAGRARIWVATLCSKGLPSADLRRGMKTGIRALRSACWGAWVAQWVKRLFSARVMISRFVSASPTSCSVLTARSLEPASDSVPPLCPSPAPACALSLCPQEGDGGPGDDSGTGSLGPRR